MAMTSQNRRIADTQNQSLEQVRQITRCFKIAVHLKEVFEMTQVLRDGGATYPARKQLAFAADVLSYFKRQLKFGDEIDLNKIGQVTLLDALCHRIVTAVGIAHVFGMNTESDLTAA